MTTDYQPARKILRKYAQVLVNYALNSGNGVKPNEVVVCNVPDVAKALALELQNVILEAGAHPLVRLLPTGFDRDYFERASSNQLEFFPRDYWLARVNMIDHQISVIADVDPNELKRVDPQKLFAGRQAKQEIRRWLTDKELQGKYTWTAALWGTQAKADMVNLSLKGYWQQIIKACMLDKADPVKEWRNLASRQAKIQTKLNDLAIDTVSVQGRDVDLQIKIGAHRQWLAGSGRNVPSFEFFTSPDWRGTEGWVRFNQPLYRFGQVCKDIYLEFSHGLVTKATAKLGNKVLQAMLKVPNANKIGEFSLTDKTMSPITHVMAETLFDENIGGKFGNTHIALGMSYKDTFSGDANKLSNLDWEELGYNDSAEHTDIVSTVDRTVLARTNKGKELILYQNGQFQI